MEMGPRYGGQLAGVRKTLEGASGSLSLHWALQNIHNMPIGCTFLILIKQDTQDVQKGMEGAEQGNTSYFLHWSCLNREDILAFGCFKKHSTNRTSDTIYHPYKLQKEISFI